MSVVSSGYMSPTTAGANSTLAGPAVASSNVSHGGQQGQRHTPPTVERLLEELQKFQTGAHRSNLEFSFKQVDLTNQLTRLTSELRAEEQTERDLTSRVVALEKAIQRERWQGNTLDAESTTDCLKSTIQQVASFSSLSPRLKASGSALTESEILSLCLGRVPRAREFSCRDMLRAKLVEVQVPVHLSDHAHLSSPNSDSGDTGPTTAAGTLSGEVRQGPLWAAHYNPWGGSTSEGDGVPIQSWKRGWTLRSHLDGARCVTFDEQGSLLISCGEDALIKGWDVSSVRRGAPDVEDLEPYVTLRAHVAPVLALSYRAKDRVLVSGGMDRYIHVWQLPESRCYNSYSSNLTAQQRAMCIGYLMGHTDSVWSLHQHAHLSRLVSASSDGTVRVWDPDLEGTTGIGTAEASLTMPLPPGCDQRELGVDVPACAAWIPTDMVQILSGFTSSRVAILDAQRCTHVTDVLTTTKGFAGGVTSLSCHNILRCAVSGHVDGKARLLDLTTGRVVAKFQEHSDAVTSVSIDPVRGFCVVTGCHDGFVRSFDLRTGRCRQALELHKRRYDEAVHCVHHAPRMLATAGADGNTMLLPAE